MYNINTVISDFIDAAMNNGIALEDGNANRANKYFRVIEKKIKWLREHDELTNQLFTDLLSHQNDYVKYHTACTLLHVHTDIVLNTISVLEKKRGILGFSAEMTIKEYRKGTI